MTLSPCIGPLSSATWTSITCWTGFSFEGVDFIDSQGSEKINELLTLAEGVEAELRLARVKPEILDMLRRDGVLDRLGEENVYGNVYEAAKDHIPATPGN